MTMIPGMPQTAAGRLWDDMIAHVNDCATQQPEPVAVSCVAHLGDTFAWYAAVALDEHALPEIRPITYLAGTTRTEQQARQRAASARTALQEGKAFGAYLTRDYSDDVRVVAVGSAAVAVGAVGVALIGWTGFAYGLLAASGLGALIAAGYGVSAARHRLVAARTMRTRPDLTVLPRRPR